MPTYADLAWHAKSRLHGWRARRVLRTPPLRARDDGVLILSMIGHRALWPYLVAAKSFGRALGRGRFVIIDDGTLRPADRALLARHLDGPEILPVAAVDTGPCPRGGTWERLLTILDRRAGHYVIQLDSDTVTIGGAVHEVATAIEANRSFTLRGEADARLMGAAAFAVARPPLPAGRPHVQRAMEAVIEQVGIRGLRYVRGCSGFAGFARSGDGRALAERVSAEGERLLGPDRWREWGTEQLTSNLVIANEPDPLLLPYERYLNYWGKATPPDARLIHFLGTCRFTGDAYARATAAAIGRLSAA